jgi:Leucine rich repeat N-terminal domain
MYVQSYTELRSYSSPKSFICRVLCALFVYLHCVPSAVDHTHVSALAAAAGPSSTSTCPAACFCNAPSRIVYCSRRGLTAVPDGVAADSLQLNLNGNVFQSTTLRRGNFSGMVALEHLYLSECGIERLEVYNLLSYNISYYCQLSRHFECSVV